MLAQTSNARMQRGAGRVPIERVPYPVPLALERLAGFRHAILIGAKEPVAFFAYPDKPSRMLPDDCQVHHLASPEQDSAQVLADLSAALDAGNAVAPVFTLKPPARPEGLLTPAQIALCVAALLPENAIVADESISSGRAFFQHIRDVPAHDWIQITGGAIGNGPPLATGAAVACPDRWVINLQADGSAMYSLQALWTQAREQLKVITIILANRAYAILQGEMRNVGVEKPGPSAQSMLELTRPELDWVQLAQGMGVSAGRADNCAEFNRLFQQALASDGPFLIEAVI
jgi:acetolactate synthase-1/2/3 large subunit